MATSAGSQLFCFQFLQGCAQFSKTIVCVFSGNLVGLVQHGIQIPPLGCEHGLHVDPLGRLNPGKGGFQFFKARALGGPLFFLQGCNLFLQCLLESKGFTDLVAYHELKIDLFLHLFFGYPGIQNPWIHLDIECLT